ncbi:MAG: hypothetical protein RBT34_05960 [Anaerolineaceae bacterium]|jgi:hypothetical protein|nr:hypothetical protein [Anaerolineaceae bacterium]
MSQYLVYLPVVFLAATSILLLMSRNWRVCVLALAVQYLAAFWLVALIWPVGLAAVKLVAGWMAGSLIGAAQPEDELVDEHFKGWAGRALRLIAALVILLVAYTLVPAVQEWIPGSAAIVWGGILLIGMGVLQLGMTTLTLRVFFGLLTIVTGFEILYAVVEYSVLVTGILAFINLGLALVCAYLLASPTMQEET